MNNATSRLGILVASVVIVALLAGTWFLGIGPRLAEASAADSERETVETANTGHEATLARLEKLDADLPALREELAVLRAAFPADSAFAAYYREVEAIGAATGVTINVLGFEGPELYVPAEVETANSQLQAALGSVSPDNFATHSVTIQIEGAYPAVLDAITRMQATQRYVLLHDVSLPEGLVAGEGAASATLTGQMFLLRDASAAPVTDQPEAPSDESVTVN